MKTNDSNASNSLYVSQMEAAVIAKLKITPERALEVDLPIVATQEMGHAFVANHFHLNPRIDLCPSRTTDLLNMLAVNGRTSHAPTTPFREACIGFAGVIAEEMLRSKEPLEKWDIENICGFFEEEGLVDPRALAAVNGHPQKLRAAKMAWRILEKHRAKLETMTPELIRQFKQRYPGGVSMELGVAKVQRA